MSPAIFLIGSVIIALATAFNINPNRPRCPAGTTQLSGTTPKSPADPSSSNNAIYGCGLTPCGSRYGSTTIDACRSACQSNPQCRSFTFADIGQDRNNAGNRVCTLYPTIVPTGKWTGVDGRLYQSFCQMNQNQDQNQDQNQNQNPCPIGSDQLGGLGAGNRYSLFGASPSRQYRTIDQCRNYYCYPRGCKAFSWDPSIRECRLYARSEVSFTYQPGHPGADQILCDSPRFNYAESNGLSNIDTVGTVNDNGETMTISVYIIYGVTGLLLVNIICLMINCWNGYGRKGNGKNKYKVVSMRSDDDSSDV